MTEDSPTESLSFERGLLLLRRRWRIFAAVWLATAGGVAIWTFSQTRLYRPQASLEIRPERATIQTMSDPNGYADSWLWENYYRTQQNIISGQTIAEETIKSLPPSLQATFAGERGAALLTENIDIEQVRTSYVMKVGYVDQDPDRATQIVNTLVAVFIEDASRRMRSMRATTAETLTKETLPDIRKQVQAAEENLRSFQKQSGFMDFEERYAQLVSSWKKVADRLTEVGLARVRLTAVIDSLKSYGTDGASGIFNPNFNETKGLELLAQERARISNDLAASSASLKPGHPRMLKLRDELKDVETRIHEAIEGTLLALRSDVSAAEKEEAALLEERKKLEAAMNDAGGLRSEHERLQSERTGARELFAAYLKRQGEESATAGTGVSSVRVIDFAKVPTTPWKPNRVQYLALGAALGLFLGAGAMFIAEKLDNRILNSDEVRVFVGMDVLATIPRLSGATAESPVMIGDLESVSEFEAFRELRAQVVTRLEKLGEGRVLCVLSPLAGEGKTTVAANLARALALEGRRVLLFDADLRKPRLRGLLKDANGPGLDEVLDGTATLEQAARPSVIKGVDIVGVKQGKSSAAELASSPRFEEALRSARERYDFVLIDSAPVLHASESALIARRADAAILVLRERQTGRGVARAASDRLAEMEVRVLGAVLNCADTRRDGYGYGYGYGYGEKERTSKAGAP